jgi:Na+/proline symporter
MGAGTIVLFGLYWKRGNVYGAYAGLIAGAIIPIANYILQQLHGDSYPITAVQSALIAYVVAIPHFSPVRL